MQDQKFTLPFPSLQVRVGVLVADGYGISLRVLYGKLHIEDGIGPHRRSITLDRVGSGLERLVLIGKSGTVTLEALAWLRAIGATLIQLNPNGDVLAHSVPFGYDGQPIRRAQALAVATGLDVDVARDLITQKLAGQRANLSRLRVNPQGFDALCETLERTTSVEQVRVCEAQAAAIYWNAWSSVPIRLRGRDLARVPPRWARYDSRASILTGAPRAATNPVNALLNYTYALLESETRLALLAAGLDPTLGVLHADQRNRDSFALDAMEPVRPDVDAFLLDLLEDRVFTSRDFAELPNGVCRITAPLTHELALTLPHWRECLRPIVADLAQTFREALSNRTVEPRIRAASAVVRGAKQRPQASPLSRTPRRASQPRPYVAKLWSAPHVEGLAANPVPCAICGKLVEKRRRRHCEACMPQARREHGLRAIERAREALRLQALAGNDPRADAETNRKRGEAIVEQRRRGREWKRENPNGAGHDRAWFLREVTPKLDDVPLSAIARVTGLSLAACSRYRTGARVPHPRHWDTLLTLIEKRPLEGVTARRVALSSQHSRLFSWRRYPMTRSSAKAHVRHPNPKHEVARPGTTLEAEVEFNRRKIKADGYSMSIGEITSIYERGELDIHPEFQRYFRWNDQQKSDLVESILLGIPLPSIFVSQRDDGVWDVVDGLQRLSTIFQFQGKLKDEGGGLEAPLTLTETTYLPLLKGRQFPSTDERGDHKHFISDALALDFKRSKLDLKIILRSSDPGQEYDLFQRLNTGGAQLSDQEVRNNLLIMANRADFRKLKELSSQGSFQTTLGLSDRLADEQYDMELALRFILLYRMPLSDLHGLRDLNKFLNQNMLEASRKKALITASITEDFTKTFRLLDSALESNAFRRYSSIAESFTGGFLVSAFEVIGLGLGNNVASWKMSKVDANAVRRKVQSAWDAHGFLAKPRMGVPGAARIPEAISAGRKLFKR